jgi:hypothetical protein
MCSPRNGNTRNSCTKIKPLKEGTGSFHRKRFLDRIDLSPQLIKELSGEDKV